MDVGNFHRCRLQISQNFGSVILANLPTRVLLCLLNNSKGSVGMTDLKIKRIFGGIGSLYRCRLQILANSSGKHFGWNGRNQVHRPSVVCMFYRELSSARSIPRVMWSFPDIDLGEILFDLRQHEVLQSGFGVIFYFGLANLGHLPANFSVNFDGDFFRESFGLVFHDFRPTIKFTAQIHA